MRRGYGARALVAAALVAISIPAVGATARDQKKDEEKPAVRGIERTDENSRIVHQELLAKRKQGKIDVYFVGDSITRRWGTSDSAWSALLANWRKNFHGWNAADFGWGGDTVENILWRLENGELDGVDPKVVVVMGGTNNIGKEPPSGENDPRIDQIVRGIEAILAVCREKAPKATIVLMGITPRTDNPAVMPIVEAVNERIASFADGKKVRFVDINAKLVDENGTFREGMAQPDGLHLDVGAYQVWADAIRPILTEVLGPPAKEDHAPPPSSDPSARKKPAS
jgi:lysophospholipase L1-like esterase